MSIIKFTKTDLDKKIGKSFLVRDLWLNPKISDSILIDEDLIYALDKFAEHFGSQVKFNSPNAIYRTSTTNASAGGAKNSYHVKGMAADFSIDDVMPIDLARYAEVIGMGGIGVYASGKHIHVDTRQGKARWWIITSQSNTPGFGGVPTLFYFGHRSPAVADIQRALNEAGFKCGKVDGLFGSKTRVALTAYQRSVGLLHDGVFGKETNDVLHVFKW